MAYKLRVVCPIWQSPDTGRNCPYSAIRKCSTGSVALFIGEVLLYRESEELIVNPRRVEDFVAGREIGCEW